jgi:hypothetical protein
MAEVMLISRPAAIIYKHRNTNVIYYLLLQRLISMEDRLELEAFLNDHYSLVSIGSDQFYIRNDKLKAAE